MNSIQGSKVLPAKEGRNEKESGKREPGWRATAAEGEREKELSGEGGHTAAGAAGLVDDDMNQEDGGAGGGQESEQQPKELIPEGMEGERVQSVPRPVPRRRLRHRFTQWQLEELERIFQTNYFISIEARKQLARWMGVSEATVKRWFQKRREQYRRYKRL
ncbi:uncharacterized protein LOC102920168 [Peromyscus maniculatus bairdii]|uniref:Homeobox domain-containing protein n=1 Tax=Peromyscus maniculatus bairdii TaxID=230844 RepID=A0A8C8T9B8_PERMB|nr:rhox homeobox family member 1-like [Peromyscus maniculatus bairdii]